MRIYYILALSLLTLLLPHKAWSSRTRAWSVSEAASSKCVNKVTSSQEAEQVLKDAEIKASGLTDSEKVTLASALKTINTRGGSQMRKAFHDLRFSVQDNLRGASGREIAGLGGYSSIRLNRDVFTTGATSRLHAYTEATITHELGHTIAHRRNLYSKYNRAAKQKCQISSYCTHRLSVDGSNSAPHRSRNEEFAEVFAAYFYNPEGLKSQCPDSYKFLDEEVFKKTGSEALVANTCSPNAFQRAYQRTDGQIVPVGDAPSAPTRGTPMYFSFGDFLKNLFSPRKLNVHGDAPQEANPQKVQSGNRDSKTRVSGD